MNTRFSTVLVEDNVSVMMLDVLNVAVPVGPAGAVIGTQLVGTLKSPEVGVALQVALVWA